MLIFLPAENSDIDLLNDIAIRSKAWWGYDDHLMKQFAENSLISGELVDGTTVIKVCMEDRIIGWYMYKPDEVGVELTDFWMSPEYIGKGYGGKMFQNLKERVMQDDYYSIVFDADPNAAPFYEHMGCRIIGQALSEWNRFIPKMRIDL
jgi:GNAT superfamily N-acetyltransferase